MSSKGQRNICTAMSAVLGLCLVGLKLLEQDIELQEQQQHLHDSVISSALAALPDTFDVWDNCTISGEFMAGHNNITTTATTTTLPLWLPSYPGSGASSASGVGFVRDVVTALTGPRKIAKNFYTKHCVKPDETSVCFQIHPVVGVKIPPLEQHVFNENVILLLRHPLTAIPSHYQDKAERYHHVRGQVPENDWRLFRDDVLAQTMTSWSSVIRAWHNLSGYQVTYYLSYERLLNFATGPTVMRELATMLQQQGFAVPATDGDRECGWYRSVGGAPPLLAHATHGGYGDHYQHYIPGYTTGQRDMVQAKLQELRQEYADIPALQAILQEYLQALPHIKLDHAWVNATHAGD